MKKSSTKFRTLLLLTVSAIIAGVTLSCENKMGSIPKSELLNLPTLAAKGVKTVWIDSGLLQLILSAPEVEQHENSDAPYSEFKSGISVIYFEGKEDTVATINAKYAKYYKKTNTWELRDSVVVVNEEGEKIETEELNWDQSKDRIYTDRLVKITNAESITIGTGLESDSRMNKVIIKKVSAKIPLKDGE